MTHGVTVLDFPFGFCRSVDLLRCGRVEWIEQCVPPCLTLRSVRPFTFCRGSSHPVVEFPDLVIEDSYDYVSRSILSWSDRPRPSRAHVWWNPPELRMWCLRRCGCRRRRLIIHRPSLLPLLSPSLFYFPVALAVSTLLWSDLHQ